jgi:hypothetical protein
MLWKNNFQSNVYGHMNVDQNKIGGPIIINVLVHGKPMGTTGCSQTSCSRYARKLRKK